MARSFVGRSLKYRTLPIEECPAWACPQVDQDQGPVRAGVAVAGDSQREREQILDLLGSFSPLIATPHFHLRIGIDTLGIEV